MLCGVGNLSYVDDDLSASPRKFHSRKPKKNPYSSRGLDKFSEVVAQLKAKRERILKQVDAPETSVRFMYMDSNWIPIIVKQQLPKHGEEGNRKWDGKKGNKHGSSKCPSGPSVKVLEKGKVEKATSDMVVGRTRGGSKRGRLRWQCRWPTYSCLFIILLILLCLALFGRIFAICCTSTWWYVVPAALERPPGDRNATTRKKTGGRSEVQVWWQNKLLKS